MNTQIFKSSSFLQGAALIIVVGLLYGYSVTFDYVLDDKIVLTDNSYVKEGFAGIGKILTTEGFEGYFGEQRDLVIGARYRPLSLVMFAIEYGLVGMNPWLSHLMNLLMYGLLGIVLLKWFELNFKDYRKKWFLTLPFLMAILYLLHPVHIEAVANIKGRDEILAMLFSMLSLIWAQKYIREKSAKYLALLFGGFLLALLSKENSISFFFVIPFTLFWIEKASIKKALPVLGVLAVVTAAYLGMRYNAVGFVIPQAPAVTGDLMNDPFLQMDEMQKYATIVYTMGKYLLLLIWPHPLTHDYYPYHVPICNWEDGAVIASLIAYGIMALAAVLLRRKYPWGIWAILFFFATITLMSNLFFTVGTFMNERFVFMPSLAFVIMLGLGINSMMVREKFPRFGYFVLGVILLGYITKDLTRIPDWKDPFALNESAIQISKNSARINMFISTNYFNQALELQDKNERRQLFEQCKKYLTRSKNIYRLYWSANNMLSGVCAEMYKDDGDIDALLACFKDVVTDRPDVKYVDQFISFLISNGDHVSKVAEFYESAGYDKLYLERNNFPHAIRYLREAEKLNPGSRTLFEKLSSVYLAFGYHLQDYPDPNYKAADMIESGRYYGNKAVQQ